MSHLTADAVFVVHVSRETPDVTPCHTSPPQGELVNMEPRLGDIAKGGSAEVQNTKYLFKDF